MWRRWFLRLCCNLTTEFCHQEFCYQKFCDQTLCDHDTCEQEFCNQNYCEKVFCDQGFCNQQAHGDFTKIMRTPGKPYRLYLLDEIRLETKPKICIVIENGNFISERHKTKQTQLEAAGDPQIE